MVVELPTGGLFVLLVIDRLLGAGVHLHGGGGGECAAQQSGAGHPGQDEEPPARWGL